MCMQGPVTISKNHQIWEPLEDVLERIFSWAYLMFAQGAMRRRYWMSNCRAACMQAVDTLWAHIVNPTCQFDAR